VEVVTITEVSTAIMDMAGITSGADMATTDMATDMATDMVMDMVMEDLISDAEVNLN
jgi:hypothetical protein